MTDKELLECAAKAAGWMPNNNWSWSERANSYRYRLNGDWVEWNPLTDDGDALRLAVKLGMTVIVDLINRMVLVERTAIGNRIVLDGVKDFNAATRYAVVGVAAEIGKAIP